MFKKFMLASAAIVVTLGPLAASAGEVYHRVSNEQARINAGVRDGQLTNREYNRVDGRLDRINASRVRDLRANNGHLTGAEYRNLNGRENALSDQIYFDRHNLARQRGGRR